MTKTISPNHASSRGVHINSGSGASLTPVDIGHSEYMGLVDPDSAFWSLIRKEKLGDALTDGNFLKSYREKRKVFLKEMDTLRFGLKPSAVYFNPTDRCNLNCSYCYISENIRRGGEHMSTEKLIEALGNLKSFFSETIGDETKPQIIFHGSEPLLNKSAVFAGIEKYKDDFLFGVQTNGTNLNDEAIAFLTSNNIGIGLSLDSHRSEVADSTRKTWSGESVFQSVVDTLEKLKGYPNYNVICTATANNMEDLPGIIEFFHSMEVPACMLNPVRITMPGGRKVKPEDHRLAEYYLKALDKSHELYKKTGRKIVVANFANIVLSIVAPLARRLMCDISPCGGGRCFFAVSAKGDMYPCSEFISLDEYKGGNIFEGDIQSAFNSFAFQKVIGRTVEDITPCKQCAIRHYCGSPCPAEAAEAHGDINLPGGFCELYEEQARYAFRLIADGKENDFLWDNWDDGTSTTINITSL
ncbi:radical SAM protein [hydrothermal vent metagenome]|uniref:Radical SAM protein n=1 Tax=hydrothermal vent metagenome TaxID=652676 RepID=A0A3B1BMU0_9ZZZZ